MYFTIAGNTKTDKELIKKATKEVGKRTSFLPKTIKYSVIETEEQLHVLGKVLEHESRSSVTSMRQKIIHLFRRKRTWQKKKNH